MLEEGLDLRGEGKRSAVPIIVKRLDSEPVPYTEERPGLSIPKGKREHAAKQRDAGSSMLFPGVKNGFGVAVRFVAMSGGFQRRPECGVIEDFAVIGDPDGFVFVGHRLGPAGKIDN